jgi:hypothetical protein
MEVDESMKQEKNKPILLTQHKTSPTSVISTIDGLTLNTPSGTGDRFKNRH